MTDTVFIKDLRVDAVIGVYDWERELKQPLSIDIEMAFDNKPAAASDDLNHALDYNAVAHRIERLIANSNSHLVETLAENLAATILADFSADSVTLSVSKLAALKNAAAVGVKITRAKK